MRKWQVEYLSRPDEQEHIEVLDDYRKACLLAKWMSDKHDGSATVIAMDDDRATGHIGFMFGMVDEQVGVLAKIDVPRE